MTQHSTPNDPPPLGISSEKVCYIIAKAHEFEADDEESESEPGTNPTEDRNLSMLEEQGDTSVEDEDEADDEESDSEPDSSPIDDENLLETKEQGDTSVEDELMVFIDGLNEDEQIDLVALAWLGRGDGSIEDWDALRRQATDAHNERTAAYLLGIPLLPDYLDEALAVFGHSCEDIER